MKLAYADPVYLGMSKRYPEHPESHIFDDVQTHADLIARLDSDYDGWAYSMSSVSLPHILPHVPDGVRIAAWLKSFAAFKPNVRIAYTWEPVLFVPARDSSKDGAPVGRDHLVEPITLRKGLVGAKPERFCRWVLDLMGYRPDSDSVDDIYPGTGVMGRVVDNYQMGIDYSVDASLTATSAQALTLMEGTENGSHANG